MHTNVSSPRSRTGPILAVVSLALMTVVSAVSGLNVALPDLARETGASQTEITWIVDAYTVVFAGLLLFAGALGDRFGRRGLLAAGLGVFGAAAGLGMLTSDPTQLIILRALMGIGAAAIMPTTLSVITTSFPEKDRPKAIGVWVGVAGGGAVLGLFGSGILLEFFSWSSFFGLNVVLAAVALVGTLLVVPSSVDSNPPRLDLLGGLLSLVAVAGIVFGIIEGAEHGWGDSLTVGGLAAGIVALAAFILWELHVEQPMLDPRLFRNRSFSAGALTMTVQFFATFGLFFVVIQYLQFVVGRSPLEAALALLPLPMVMIPLSRQAPRIARRVGFRRLAPAGLVLMAVGLVVISQVNTDLAYGAVRPGPRAVRHRDGARRHTRDHGHHRVAAPKQARGRLRGQRHRTRAGQRAWHCHPRRRPEPAVPRRHGRRRSGAPACRGRGRPELHRLHPVRAGRTVRTSRSEPRRDRAARVRGRHLWRPADRRRDRGGHRGRRRTPLPRTDSGTQPGLRGDPRRRADRREGRRPGFLVGQADPFDFANGSA